ncbi:unnamed protein product [Peniophora sp. CBMAI 1063]|nr:unnamed protein product [Peniophora sp. CBMAI 1063]
MAKSKSTRDTSSMDTDSQAGDGASADSSTRARPQRARQPPKRYQHTPEPEIVDVAGEDSQPSEIAGDALQPAPARPKKNQASASTTKRSRKKAVVDSDDEVNDPPRVSPPPESRSRTAESDPAEDDLSVGRPSPLHSPAAGSSKRKLTFARKRKTVDSDEERDAYLARGTRARSESDVEDNFIVDSPPPLKRKKSLPPVKVRGGKGKDKEIVLGKDERMARSVSRDEGTPMDVETTPSASPAPITTGAAPPMPQFKKKLPSMRKTSSVAGSSAGNGTPARSRPKAADPPVAEEADTSLDFKKPKKVAAKQELNLMDKSTYASLFKSGSAPRGGVDVKSKEEKRAAMNKLRDEDCARREAQWSNTFDLRAQYEKVTGFAKKMEARKGPSIYPNILASSLRMEFDRRRKQG